jgi:steroid delta-isomerase-like uncharacterized protein
MNTPTLVLLLAFTLSFVISSPIMSLAQQEQATELQSEQIGMSGQSAKEIENINTAREVINAFNTGNVTNVSSFISEQYFNHESQIDPVRGQLRGPTEFIDTIKNNRIAFPDLRHNEEQIIAQDDIVVSVINVTGTHTGNFFILPPTGNAISYDAAHVYRIGEDGKIVEHKAIRDDLTFLAQMGIIGPTSPEFAPFFEILTGTGNRTMENSADQ